MAPGVGANGIAFRVGGREILESPPSPEDLLSLPAHAGCPVLFPFPGYTPAGRYVFEGREYAPSLLVHGFTHRRPWRLLEQDATSCTCAFDESLLSQEDSAAYPWPFRVTLRWTVHPGVFRADVWVENTGSTDLPFGFGLHPYLLVDDDALVHIPAASVWAHERGIPTGRPRPTQASWIWADLEPASSTLLTDLPGDVVQATAGGARVRFPGDRFGDVVLFRPPGSRRSVCIEPWTNVSAGAAIIPPGEPHGLLRLRPGAVWDAWLELVAG